MPPERSPRRAGEAIDDLDDGESSFGLEPGSADCRQPPATNATGCHCEPGGVASPRSPSVSVPTGRIDSSAALRRRDFSPATESAARASSALSWSNASDPDRSRNLGLRLIHSQRSTVRVVTAVPSNGAAVQARLPWHRKPGPGVPAQRRARQDARGEARRWRGRERRDPGPVAAALTVGHDADHAVALVRGGLRDVVSVADVGVAVGGRVDAGVGSDDGPKPENVAVGAFTKGSPRPQNWG